MTSQPEAPVPGPPNESPTFEQLEATIAVGLPRRAEAELQVALALLEIHCRKLYRPGYKSFALYLTTRWNMKRARAYQLLHFARLKQMSTTVDTNSPANERQARALDTHGKARRPSEHDPVTRAMNYLADLYDRLTVDQARDLIESIKALLSDMERDLKKGKP